MKSHIKAFFYNPVDARSLGFFRIAISTFALVQLFILLPDWMVLYGPEGLLPWEVSDALSTTSMPSISAVHSLLKPLGLSHTETVYGITCLYFLSLVGLGIGYRTHVMGALAWLTHLILNTTGHFTAYGVETFTHIALFYCMVLPVGVTWGVQSASGKVPSYLVTLSLRVLQLHLAVMYMASGIEKALGHQWWNGDAIWLALQQDQFRQFNTEWLASYPILLKLLCWGTLLVETFYPVGIFMRRTRAWWLIAIVGMHVGIAVFLGLHLFGALMILLNVSAFGHQAFRNSFSFSRRPTSLEVMPAFVKSARV